MGDVYMIINKRLPNTSLAQVIVDFNREVVRGYILKLNV